MDPKPQWFDEKVTATPFLRLFAFFCGKKDIGFAQLESCADGFNISASQRLCGRMRSRVRWQVAEDGGRCVGASVRHGVAGKETPFPFLRVFAIFAAKDSLWSALRGEKADASATRPYQGDAG